MMGLSILERCLLHTETEPDVFPVSHSLIITLTLYATFRQCDDINMNLLLGYRV